MPRRDTLRHLPLEGWQKMAHPSCIQTLRLLLTPQATKDIMAGHQRHLKIKNPIRDRGYRLRACKWFHRRGSEHQEYYLNGLEEF